MTALWDAIYFVDEERLNWLKKATEEKWRHLIDHDVEADKKDNYDEDNDDDDDDDDDDSTNNISTL